MSAKWIADQGREPDLAFDFERDLLCTAENGYLTSVNGGWERVLGWTREELMSRPYLDFVHPADRGQTLEQASRVKQDGGQTVNFENRCRARGGGWRWLRWSARSDGDSWFAVAFDVTQRKETEHRLRRLLTDEHLLAYSQPILDQRRRSVVQEELLVRLRVPRENDVVMTPSDFLPDVEACGLIGVVDRWMVTQGLTLASHGRLAEVNLSARSIEDEALAKELEQAIGRAGASAENLIFEITETATIEQLDAACDFAQ
jgi:PAS domain S-box-containing protein